MVFTDEIEPRDVNEQGRDDANDAPDGEHDGGLKQINPLTNADEDERRDRADERGNNAGEHHIRRIERVLRRAITNDRRRNEREPGRVQTKEHDLRIARAVLVLVQFLQTLHRL